MRLSTALICASLLASGCSREDEKARPALERAQEKLSAANAAHARGDADLAIETAEALRQERAAAEELRIERPDPPAHGSEAP